MSGREEVILTLDSGASHVVSLLGVKRIGGSAKTERMGGEPMEVKEMRVPEMTRWREPNQRLVWLVHCYFAKLNPTLREAGWTDEALADAGERAWKVCKSKGCVSFGGVGGVALDNKNLRAESASDRQQLARMVNFVPGDLVVATLGQRMFAWGTAVVGARGGLVYEYEPSELSAARQEFGNWFWHCAWVRWHGVFGKSGVLLPTAIPLQPTIRYPHPSNSAAWDFLRSNGVPVGPHGEVDEHRTFEAEEE